jgi:protein TonB
MAADAAERERFNFTMFLSIAAHGILIFGISFGAAQSTSETPTLDITLAAHHSKIAPERADFLAQANQLGSGSLAEDATPVAPTSPFQADFESATLQAAGPIAPEQRALQRQDSTEVVVTSAEARAQSSDTLTVTEDGDAQLSTPDSTRLAIASLIAQLDSEVQEYARRPRRVVLTAASTQRSEDALYLDGWRRRIEAIGNLNYPDAAKRQKLYGSLRLLVSILPNGSIQKTEILQSSGHAILDQAALDIVMLASPYEPFPPELSKQADVVEIIRTWRFHEGNALRSY